MGRLTNKAAVVCDRHPLWLEGLNRLLDREGIAVVGSTTNPTKALALVESHRPDMLVAGLEFSNGGIDELACLERARKFDPELKVVALSAQSDPQLVGAAFAAGATVFCAKTADADDLASAIRQAFQQSVHFAAEHARTIAAATVPSAGVGPGLTRRELEILRLVADGTSNSQLARKLWVTEQTVKFHLSNIYKKLNVANRTGASRWAQLHGLLSEPEQIGVGAAAA